MSEEKVEICQVSTRKKSKSKRKVAERRAKRAFKQASKQQVLAELLPKEVLSRFKSNGNGRNSDATQGLYQNYLKQKKIGNPIACAGLVRDLPHTIKEKIGNKEELTKEEQQSVAKMFKQKKGKGGKKNTFYLEITSKGDEFLEEVIEGRNKFTMEQLRQLFSRQERQKGY